MESTIFGTANASVAVLFFLAMRVSHAWLQMRGCELACRDISQAAGICSATSSVFAEAGMGAHATASRLRRERRGSPHKESNLGCRGHSASARTIYEDKRRNDED